MPKKKEEGGPQVDLNSMPLKAALEFLNKKYGAGTFVLASKAKGALLRFTPTGIHALDFSLGGGWPQNRIIEIHGNWSTFKSTVSLLGIANHQQFYPDGLGVYVDLERSFDAVYAERLGVDLDRLVLIDPNTGEDSIDELRDILEINVPHFVVVDSVAAMRPTAELDADMDQAFMGHHARLVGRAMGVLNGRLKRSVAEVSIKPVTVLALNQLRSNIGMYVAPESTPGGRAKDFYYSVAVRFSAKSADEYNETKTVNGVKRKIRISQTVEFKVKKNKTGGPQNAEDEFTFYERPSGIFKKFQVDNYKALLKYGLYYQLISKHSDYSLTFDDGTKISAARESDFFKKLSTTSEEKLDWLYYAILDEIKKEIEKDTDEPEPSAGRKFRLRQSKK